jgi:hypothetical protein
MDGFTEGIVSQYVMDQLKAVRAMAHQLCDEAMSSRSRERHFPNLDDDGESGSTCYGVSQDTPSFIDKKPDLNYVA